VWGGAEVGGERVLEKKVDYFNGTATTRSCMTTLSLPYFLLRCLCFSSICDDDGGGVHSLF